MTRCQRWNTDDYGAPNRKCTLDADHTGTHHYGCGHMLDGWSGWWCILQRDHVGPHWEGVR